MNEFDIKKLRKKDIDDSVDNIFEIKEKPETCDIKKIKNYYNNWYTYELKYK